MKNRKVFIFVYLYIYIFVFLILNTNIMDSLRIELSKLYAEDLKSPPFSNRAAILIFKI